MNFVLFAVSASDYQTFIADKQKGMSTPQALAGLGLGAPGTGLATKTTPFDTSRTTNNFNQQ
jgi:hypothetical protein